MKLDLVGTMKKGNLKYVKHGEIDYEKWDQCIEGAVNSRVYATTWFLDRTAVTWDALIYGNYEHVMPLPVKQKFGIQFLYQPHYCQQLGIFPPPAGPLALEFFTNVLKVFNYADIQINSLNLPANNLEDIKISSRKNYLLHLGTGYDVLSSAFSEYTSRNIFRAEGNNLNFVKGIRLEDYMTFKKKNMPVEISASGLGKLKSLIAYSQYKGIGETFGIYSAENELCAAAFFCRWKERVVYLNAVSSIKGKETRAMFHLINHFIESNANKNLILDFEGSMLPGVARFFEGFGATAETYYQLKFNKLPVILKWMKRFHNE
jgi:hypothetical protein